MDKNKAWHLINHTVGGLYYLSNNKQMTARVILDTKPKPFLSIFKITSEINKCEFETDEKYKGDKSLL